MIEHELILLGLLKGGPKHGYEIKKEIKEILSLFAGVNPKSIYYPLRVLEKKKLVVKHRAKEGNRPMRIVYTLSLKGELLFKELLSKSFLNFKRPEFSLDLSLYFLHYLKPKEAKRRLHARTVILNKIYHSLAQMLVSFKSDKNTPSLKRILDHNLDMLKSEANCLSGLTKTL